MELLFLGTGAADWPYHPAEEWAADQDNRIRRTSSALLDGKILIDPAPASFQYASLLGVDLTRITDVLLTHSHADHFDSDALSAFAQAAARPLRFWYHTGARREKLSLPRALVMQLELHPVETMQDFSIDGYTVTALPGNHLYGEYLPEVTLHYLLRHNEASLYYALDGGWFTAVEWEYLMHQQLDCVVLDATCGDYNGDFRLGTHNSIPMLRLMRPSLYQNGALREGGRIVLSHLARTLHAPNDEVAAQLSEEGFLVAQDGLKLII